MSQSNPAEPARVEPQFAVAAFIAAAPAVEAERRAAILRMATAALTGLSGVLIATCHRVELYTADAPAAPSVRDELVRAGMTELGGDEAARAVIGLALGLRSAVLGEDQVLHQVRTAVAEARERAPLAPALGLLMDHALRAGRVARSWRPVGHGDAPRSLGDLAVARVETVSGPVEGRRVMIVGAGSMGRGAAVAALRRHAHVAVASRTYAHAQALAHEIGAEPVALDDEAGFAAINAVVVALSGPWVLNVATRRHLAGRAVVVDLSMPAALPAGLRSELGDRFIGIDDLAVAGAPDAAEARFRDRLEQLAEQTLAEYRTDLATRDASAADRLAAHIERHRRAELEAWLRRRPDLDPAARASVEDLSRDLSARLFREPLARLGRDPEGRRRRALEELFDA